MVLPWILAGLVGVVILALLLHLGGALLRSLQRAVVALLVASVVLVLGLAAWAQARATRQAAVAATVAARGQTTATVGLTLLALLLGIAVLVAGGVIAYLMLRLRRLEYTVRQGEESWRGNPWGDEAPSGISAWPDSPRLTQTAQTNGLLRDLIQLETLRLLQGYELTLAHNRPTDAFPPASFSDDLPLARQGASEETAGADDDFPWDTWV
jgi:hypothetical protein